MEIDTGANDEKTDIANDEKTDMASMLTGAKSPAVKKLRANLESDVEPFRSDRNAPSVQRERERER